MSWVCWLIDSANLRPSPHPSPHKPHTRAQVLYGQKLKWPSSASGGGVKEAFRRRLLPGIRVRYIDDPAHLLRGQYGVYATREFHVCV